MAWKRPDRRLDRVDLTLHLPSHETDGGWKLTALGRCTNVRESLWSRKWEWTSSEVDNGLQVCDQLTWFSHVVTQDRPSSPFWLDRAERGLPVGVQGVLFD